MKNQSQATPLDQNQSIATNQGWFRLASYLISALLLACFAASFVQLGEFFFPDWNGFYLALVGFFTALDGMFAFNRLRHFAFPDKEWVFYRFSEWIVILLLLKLGTYFSQGYQAFGMDINYLVNRQWGDLLSGEFLFSVLVMLVIWMFSGRFADLLGRLDVDERLLKVEQESGIYELRTEVRESLVSTVLILGVIMVLVTSLLGMEAQSNWRQNPDMRAGVINLLVFFFLTLFLFSLTQLNLMSTTWIREGLTIRKELVRHWLLSSAFAIFILTIISAILPTRYSISLLSLLNYIFSALVSLFSYLIFFISAPFFMIVAFLASLFKFSGAENIQQPEPVMDLPPPPVDAAQLPWLELLKSILFWVVLAGMLIFAIYYYFRENQALWSGIRRLGLSRRLYQFWLWISGQLRRTNQVIQAKVQQSLAALRSRFQSSEQTRLTQRLNLRRLSNREKVFFYYLAMLRRSSERGPARQPWQTPYEYLQELKARYTIPANPQLEIGLDLPDRMALQADEEDLDWSPVAQDQANPQAEQDWLSETQALTEYFVQARYSTQSVTTQEANLVKQIWEHLRKALRKQPR